MDNPGENYDDPLALEHMMGFNGDCKGSVQFHPTDKKIMVSYTGCLLVIADVTNPHEQEFLRGHNEAITALAISPSGNFIASGQGSTTRVPNSEATVIVWDYATRQPLFRLMELHDGIQFSRNKVCQLAFSPDEQFLAASDDQSSGPKMCVWDVKTAQLATIKKGVDPLAFLSWGDVVASSRKSNKHASYTLLGATRQKITRFHLSFDVYSMQFKLSDDNFQLPSTGLARTYNVADVIKYQTRAGQDPGSFLVCGSGAGELCVFDVNQLVFRAAVPVSQGGVLALATIAGDGGSPPMAFCGCGDGKLKLLQGGDLEWVCLCETQLEGAIRSLTVSSDGAELLAGTSTGNIYRLHAMTLCNLDANGAQTDSRAPLLASHAKPISCLAFGDSSEWFVTASDSGTMRRWELSSYGVDFEIPPPVKTTDATAITRSECLAVRRQTVLSGWTDGVIRAYDDENGAFLWEIVSAHRGGVTCVDLTPLYIVSAGVDGSIRVWSDGPSKQLVGNFDEHKKRVNSVCVDLEKPSLIHSCSDDKTVVTINLDQARRTCCHAVKEGALRTMAQASHGELELISGDTAGALKWWDCDEQEPVHMKPTWSPMDESHKDRRLTHIDLSPPVNGGGGSDYLCCCTATGDVQVWELMVRDARLVSVGAAHSEECTMARWSPDAKQIVSVGKDACICVWNFFG